MAMYMKKPVTIQAERWFSNGDHSADGCYLVSNTDGSRFLSEGKVVRYYRDPSDDGKRHCSHCSHQMSEHGWIDTLEGGHIVCPGDWIITGVKGERYPCKPDIFDTTYELVI